MNKDLIKKITEKMKELSPSEPLVVRAPGRINLIGEHTDYNNGFVLPAAVDLSIYFSITLTGSTKCFIHSLDQGESFEFDIEEELSPIAMSWGNYVIGVIAELKKLDVKLKGFNLVFGGDLPQGSGMSSSAALECGLCMGLNELFHLDLTREKMAKVSQAAEHNFVGVKCGIMDQFASLMGKKDEVILLDCEDLSYSLHALNPAKNKLLLLNSNVKHSHTSSGYNERREQTEEGVAVVAKSYPKVRTMRDVTIEMLEQVKNEIPEVSFRRCKYIIDENRRVHEVVRAISNNDFVSFGEVLKRAQNGMKTAYEITCPEIDFLADYANGRTDVLGARMMGGGFGGCTINLIKRESEGIFQEEISKAYKEKFGFDLTPISVEISEGVELVK